MAVGALLRFMKGPRSQRTLRNTGPPVRQWRRTDTMRRLRRWALHSIMCSAVAVGLFGLALYAPWPRETRRSAVLSAVYEHAAMVGVPKSARDAEQSVVMLRTCLGSGVASATGKSRRSGELRRLRGLAVSNLVAGLEEYSGCRHGTNVQAWLDWLAARSTVQTEGAARPTAR